MLDVIKVWYQNDWGLYGRRDERIARWLARDARIGRVLHLEPPLVLARLKGLLEDPRSRDRLELNLRSNVKRLEGYDDDGVFLFTPSVRSTSISAMEAQRRVSGQILECCQRLGILQNPFILWLSPPGELSHLALELLGVRAHRIVVELEDDHRTYQPTGSAARKRLQAIYEKLVACADIVFAVSSAMAQEFGRVHPCVHHVPNAVEAQDFSETLLPPAELEGLERPVVTYVGHLTVRIDWPLLEAVARALDRGTLLMVGQAGSAAQSFCERFPNVRLHGPVRACRVPALLRWSDALILPHSVSEVTRAMDPQKLPEYLASGRPVVATPVEGTQRFGSLVRIASDPQSFGRAVLDEIARDDESQRRKRREAGLARTWRDVVAGMLQATLEVPDAGCRFKAQRKHRYHSMERPEVRALVPLTARRVLDVGCGTGALGGALKRERECEVWGIELDRDAAREAREVLDHVLEGDVSGLAGTLPESFFDAIALADVLEHVADPARLLRGLRRSLAPGGNLVLSVPNVRHWSVLRELLEGDFRYREAGLLDAGHLRFFTRRSLERLLAECDFRVNEIKTHSWSAERAPRALVEALAQAGLDVSSLEEESSVHQYLVMASCGEPAERHSRRDSPEAIMTFKISSEPTTLIVPVVNTCEVTRQLIDSLRRCTRAGSYRLVVVDNGSTDGTREFLAAQQDVVLVRESVNRGFAAAVNRGLLQAHTTYVAIMNNDVLLTEGWLDTLVTHLETDARIAFVAPSTNYAAGPQRVHIGEYSDEAAMARLAREFTERRRGQIEDVEFVVGLCLLGRRSTFATLGPFDERFGNGNFEDNDYCLRARRGGWRIIVARDVFLHHHGSQTFRALGIDYAAQMERNRVLFDEKWKDDPVVLGMAAAQRREIKEALEHFTQALTRYPASVDAYLRTASCQVLSGDSVGALRNIDRYLERCPRSRDALLMKAHALVATGRLKDALAILEVLEQTFYLPAENVRELKTTMASLHKIGGDKRAACRLLEEAFGILPPKASLGIELLETAAATGDPTVMVHAIEKLVEVEPGNLIFWLELAAARKKAGDAAGARAAWSRALEIDPACEEAREALENESLQPVSRV
ncbi:MAG: methyltransferase domain-containing protein [Planctomycetota bacterium]